MFKVKFCFIFVSGKYSLYLKYSGKCHHCRTQNICYCFDSDSIFYIYKISPISQFPETKIEIILLLGVFNENIFTLFYKLFYENKKINYDKCKVESLYNILIVIKYKQHVENIITSVLLR